jgi:hypothetical protein
MGRDPKGDDEEGKQDPIVPLKVSEPVSDWLKRVKKIGQDRREKQKMQEEVIEEMKKDEMEE